MMNPCSGCAKKSVIGLPYSGQHLCGKCFLRLFEKRVRKTIRQNRLLRSQDNTGVALSGGKSSSAVLYILHELSRNIPKAELVAITLDPGIRGHKGLEVAEKFCKELGVRHYKYSFKKEFGITMDEIVKKLKRLENPPSPCSYCSILRKRLLDEKARELGLTKIATGHNLDDEVETAMTDFIRGDLGMDGMDAKFIPIIKPLRECPGNEVELYAKLRKIPFHKAPCPYSGEDHRQTAGKVLNEMEDRHPGTRFQILRSSDQLVSILKTQRSGKIRKCKECGESTSGDLCNMCEIKGVLGF